MGFIKNYLKNLVYHFLTLVDGLVNTLGAFIGIRKIIDFGTDWLVFTETIRIDREMKAREQERKDDAISQITALVEEANRHGN